MLRRKPHYALGWDINKSTKNGVKMSVREMKRKANQYMRVNIFPCRTAPGKRGARRELTSEVQAKLNERNAENTLSDLIHNNFTPDDYIFDLDYDNRYLPKTAEDAQRLAVNAMRTIKYAWVKSGRKAENFKYVITTAVSSRGRIHHHCFITGGLPEALMRSKWKWGHAHTDPMEFDENGVRGKIHYILKDTATKRRWCASKNMRRCEPRTNDYKISAKTLRYINDHPEDTAYIERLYPGWSVAPDGVRPVAVSDKDGEIITPVIPFVEIFLYKTDNAFFERNDKYGIRYKRGAKTRENPISARVRRAHAHAREKIKEKSGEGVFPLR